MNLLLPKGIQATTLKTTKASKDIHKLDHKMIKPSTGHNLMRPHKSKAALY